MTPDADRMLNPERPTETLEQKAARLETEIRASHGTPSHTCPPGHLYACPTALEVESSCHGGFDVCCDRPDLHVPLPEGPATDALSKALSDAAKERFALAQELDRWRPSHAVTHHTYEGPGLCRADLFGQTCGEPRDDHELICDGD